MTARFANDKEVSNWDKLILSNPDGGNVFSSYEFAMIKKLTGYNAKFIIADDCAITVLEKSTPPLGKLWYLPKGPNVTTKKDLIHVLDLLMPLAKKSGAFVVRFETELDKKFENDLQTNGYKKSEPIIPNPSTITLDISPNLDDLLGSLPQKGRHAIKRAKRDGVKIKRVKSSAENCKIMYRLLSETAKGQFGIRSYNYFKKFWQSFEEAGIGQMFFAYVENKPVAGAYAMVFGKKSTYKDGASNRRRTVYGASHLLQWEVIAWAKENGSTSHDLCGSPPSNQMSNVDHPHYGIGRFKRSFSTDVVDYIGCYDAVINGIPYAAWTTIVEKIYRKIYYKKTKDYYY